VPRGDFQSYRHGYTYGPSQYLTLWPIVFLDSYRQIAMTLLPIYAAVVILIGYILWRLCEALFPLSDGCRAGHLMTVLAVVLAFGPLLIAFGQREFEVLQALAIVLGAYWLATDRTFAAGAVLGYISLFKYWPLALAGYFVMTRRWRALAGFAIAVVMVLVTAHALFGLGRFKSMSLVGAQKQWGRVYGPFTASPFCQAPNGTAASLHAGACAIAAGRSRIAAPLFYGLIAAGVVLFTVRARRSDRWRQTVDFCAVVAAAGIVFHGHYYYLSVLIMPLTLLIYRGVWAEGQASSARLWLAVASYALLSTFMVPVGLASRLTGRDIWSAYLSHGTYAYGEMLLFALLSAA
jgi:hypothetical protein